MMEHWVARICYPGATQRAGDGGYLHEIDRSDHRQREGARRQSGPAIAIELGRYQPAEIGPGLVSRVARGLQRQFMTPALGPGIARSRAWG